MGDFIAGRVRYLRTWPTRRQWLETLLVFALYAGLVLALGLGSGFFRPGWLLAPAWVMCLLPISLWVVPSLLEETIFRGLLIPPRQKRRQPDIFYLIGSTVLFVVWHPLNALICYPPARAVFYDPVFLTIVAGMGIACGALTLRSQSLWPAVFIHWASIVIWVFALGGRNILLDGVTG